MDKNNYEKGIKRNGMNTKAINQWLKLSTNDKQAVFNEVAAHMNLPSIAVEKDWWVVRTLELVFASSIASHTVFKGGTSLSKAWGLIDRFSEDIDLALDRKFLGIEKTDSEMTGSQVSKLRKLSVQFITEKYFPELQELFRKAGFSDVVVSLKEIKNLDDDPITIEVYYPSLTKSLTYIQPKVLIEVGSRSLIEPFNERSFKSFIGEYFNGRVFSDQNIIIPTVNPQRTFLEKVFLLHEEFQRPIEQIKVERKSRHLYDLEKLMDTEFALAAIQNKELYHIIVEHRRKLTAIRGIDYDNHSPDMINPIPPDALIAEWQKDYLIMQQSMLYKPSLTFDQLIDRIKELKLRINKIKPL